LSAGTQTLTDANTYSGGTTISGGKLIAGNTSGSATGTASVTLNGGALASGTIGTVSGSVAAGSGAQPISAGETAGGELDIGGNLTTSTNTTLRFDLGDLVKLTGGGSQLNASGTATVQIVGTPTLASYNLITGSTGGTAALSNYALSAPIFGYKLALG